MDIRLIATDLDGTLLDGQGGVSAENRDALVSARRAGLRIVIATGRPPSWLDMVRGIVDDLIIIASNGALILDEKMAVREMRTFAEETVAEIAAQLRSALPGATLGLQRPWRFTSERDWPGADLVSRIEDEPAEAVKILARCDERGSADMQAAVAERLEGLATVTYSRSNAPGLLELSAPGVTKAAALEELAGQLDIAPEHIAAFGDMPNDEEMLRLVGHPHLMGNAPTDLHVPGARRIGNNDEDAVGTTIREILDSNSRG
ncbi:MAG: HAD family hydrolase [Flaviflexus sp.]|nr:HAD family hydrolase [Flaviflexus sp.]